MAFKMSYAFEGNFQNRPEQNMSGASKKQTRDSLLQKAHEERQKRQEQRLKLQSTETLQSHMRSYLIRKHKKQEERILFDQNENTISFKVLLAKLLFFYDPQVDKERFVRTLKRMLAYHRKVSDELKSNASFKWLVKRTLVIALKYMNTDDCDVTLACLDKYANDSDVVQYLVRKGYFQELRLYLDTEPPNSEQVLTMIQRPFNFINASSMHKENMLAQFCNVFLSSNSTPAVKNTLIPYLKAHRNFPYTELIHFLNRCQVYENSNALLYSVLTLEPTQYEPNKDHIEVLSKLSANLHLMNGAVVDLSEDSDDEEMEICDEYLNMSDLINHFNNADRVKKILHYFMDHSNDEEVLKPLTQLCQNLLLVSKDCTRKFMLVYMLALRGTFVAKLWQFIQKEDPVALQSSSGLNVWKHTYTAVSVFCDTFMFYTQTLTDSETIDTSKTFTNSELNLMSELLKGLALSLVDVAFPMCRSNTVSATPELAHLYNSCLSCVKVLHMLDLRRNFSPPGFWTRKKIHISPDLTRKNYLSNIIRPFYGIMTENEDEHLPPLSTIEQRSLAILQQLPFLIEFNTRVLLLRHLCYYSLGTSDATRLRNEFMSDNVVVVRRTHLYEDAFEKLSPKNESDLKQRVRIQFINNVGLEEAGIDGGGIFKEFINEVLKTAFDPNRGYFLLTADNMLYPNPNVHLIVENFWDHYYFIGRLVGKAVFENILVDLPIAEFFLAKLLVDRASAHYLKSLDPVLYRNLLYLRDYQGDVQDLGLDFTLVNNDLGETRVMELKPNGSNIPVTNYNRLEYIHRLADLKLNQQIKRQCAAFREGLNSVVPLLWFKLFNHIELQVIVSGDTQEMDIDDLRAYTAYGGEFTVDHPTIISFWQILHNFSSTQKKQLLKFVTSCSRPPLLGFKELNPSFCIQSSGTEDRMPTASTCLNLLKIPVISDKEVLRNKLLAAIEQQAGFELS